MSNILHTPIQQDDRRALAPPVRHSAIMLAECRTYAEPGGLWNCKKKKEVVFLFEFLLLWLFFSGTRAYIIRLFLTECLRLSVWQVNTLITTSSLGREREQVVLIKMRLVNRLTPSVYFL